MQEAVLSKEIMLFELARDIARSSGFATGVVDDKLGLRDRQCPRLTTLDDYLAGICYGANVEYVPFDSPEDRIYFCETLGSEAIKAWRENS